MIFNNCLRIIYDVNHENYKIKLLHSFPVVRLVMNIIFSQNSLRKRIVELETVLQQNELDMKCLQEKFKELEDKYDSLNLEMPNIVISRSSSVELIPTRAIPPVSVVLVHEDKSVQVDSFDKKKESLEKEIKSLLEQIEVSFVLNR